MADFIQDNSNLGFAASALQGFAGAYKDAQDDQVKRQEAQAKLAAMKSQAQRDATDQAIKLRVANLTQSNPNDPSTLTEATPTVAQQNKSNMELTEKGLKYSTDPDTGLKTYIHDPNSPQMIGAGMKREVQTNSMDQKTNNDWEKFATTLNNPSSRATLGRYQQNLDKAGTINALAGQIGMQPGEQAPPNETKEQRIARFNNADKRQLYEFAKAADQLTSSAASTVYGTDHLMPNDMQINGAAMAEWAKGGPVPANAGQFIDRYLDSANRESNYFKQKRDSAVSGISAGFNHLKKKDPARWESVLGGLTQDQAPAQQQSAAPQSSAPQAQGLVPQGLLSRAVGFLGLGGAQNQAQAAAPTAVAPHPQDNVALKWAKENPKDPRAAAIFKENGIQ